MPQLQARLRITQPYRFVARVILHANDLSGQIAHVPQGFESTIDIHHPQLSPTADGPVRTVECAAERTEHLHAEIRCDARDQIHFADTPYFIAPSDKQCDLPPMGKNDVLRRHCELVERVAMRIDHHCAGLAQCQQVALIG
ncbi:hypothetical protein D3C77_583910 [compost metagenome]